MPDKANQAILPEDRMFHGIEPGNMSYFNAEDTDPSTPSSTGFDYDIFVGLGTPQTTIFGNPVSSLVSNGGCFDVPDTTTRPQVPPQSAYREETPSYFHEVAANITNNGYNFIGSPPRREQKSPDSDDYEQRALAELIRTMNEQELKNVSQLHQYNSVVKNLSNIRRNWVQLATNQNQQTMGMIQRDYKNLEMAARINRTSANLGGREPIMTWSGTLPPRRFEKNGNYSCKVFLGGLPYDITEEELVFGFSQFGTVKVEWPGKEQSSSKQPKGFVYIIFDNEKQVKELLACCVHDYSNGGSYYFRISSRKVKSKEVQVIPWSIDDGNHHSTSLNPTQKLDSQKTVFVGAVHGMMNAECLFRVMNELFRGVVYAGIDTDKNKYPIGSGRVTFDNFNSYATAVATGFVAIKTSKFYKKLQIDPYLEDSPCSVCTVQLGPYFCRDSSCFRYYCTMCWQKKHTGYYQNHHKPLMRNCKQTQLQNSLPLPATYRM